MLLACHLISQNHVTKGSSNIMGRSPSRLVTILPSVVVIDAVLVEVLVCHMILRDYVIKGSCGFMGRSPSN